MANRERISGSITIKATPNQVWAIVSDLQRMGQWSPQCKKMIVFGGSVHEGTRTLNFNNQGKLWWPTRSKVVEYEPERILAFRIAENHTIWSYELEEISDGTRLTETRLAPGGKVSRLSTWLTEAFLGGTKDFEENLERGIGETLGRIKAEAEGVVLP